MRLCIRKSGVIGQKITEKKRKKRKINLNA